MTNAANNREADIRSYALKLKREYSKSYRDKNPDKVKQWRHNAVINAYKKLITEEPALFVERGEFH